MDNQQTPPASIEAEEALLGGLMFDPKAIERIHNLLPVSAFYVLAHQVIYEAMLNLFQAQKPLDLIHLSTYLQDHGTLENIGGTTKLTQLLNRTISAINCDRYAQLILEKYQRRQLINFGNQISDWGYDQTQNLADIYENIKALLPSEMMEAAQKEKSLKIKSVRYSLYDQSKTKKLEMEAEINEDDNLIDATAELGETVEYTAEQLWKKD